MNTTAELAEVIRAAVDRPDRGVVGLVDELLRICAEPGLRLDWRDGRCQVHFLATHDVIDLALRKSAFRAVLARVAVLCRQPEPSSPYGGRGLLAPADDPARPIQVSFANTPDEQWLQLLAGRDHATV